MSRKRKPATFTTALKMLDKIPREEAATILQPYTGRLVKAMLEMRENPKLSGADRRTAEDLIKRTRAWLTQLRDAGLALWDLAKLYGMTERELRAFLAGEPLETH